jgi:hypothetical protein
MRTRPGEIRAKAAEALGRLGESAATPEVVSLLASEICSLAEYLRPAAIKAGVVLPPSGEHNEPSISHRLTFATVWEQNSC